MNTSQWIIGEYKWIEKDSIMLAGWVKVTTSINPKLIIGGNAPVTSKEKLTNYVESVGLNFTNGNVNGGFYPLGIKVKTGNQPFGVIAETNIETATGTPNETINPVSMNLWTDLAQATSVDAELWQYNPTKYTEQKNSN